MEARVLTTIAAQELKIYARHRWVQGFAVVFAALDLAIAYFGMVTAGQVGLQGFTRTSASLLNLILYLLPIVCLSLGALSFTGEKGAAELLFSQPVTRREILLGKLLGLFAAVAAATCFGFGLAGLVIASQSGWSGAARYAAVAGLALLLAMVFLGLGTMAGVLARSRARAFGLALLLWFFFVLFYDLAAIGVTFLLRERAANRFVFLSLFGNPVDMVRVAGLMALDGASMFGAAGAALIKFLGGAFRGGLVLLAALLVWILVPLLVADRALRRQDI
jgi:Cu-processing system permease protein